MLAVSDYDDARVLESNKRTYTYCKMSSNSPPCELCGRVMQNGTTEHHLIPRTCHKNKWFKKQFTREQMQQTVDLCRDCHNAIHELIPSEKELGRHYNTLDKLMAHEPMANFVAWAMKQK